MLKPLSVITIGMLYNMGIIFLSDYGKSLGMIRQIGLIAIAIGIAAVMISGTSMASAQQSQTSGSKFGSIASIQNGKNWKPEWIVSGEWVFKNINSSSPAFNAGWNMVMLNGSA